MPYVIGGDLYPYHIHVGSADNASDDISRFVRLRDQDIEPPLWLARLIHGDPAMFDAVFEADKLAWPFSGWSRLIRLLQLGIGNRRSAHAPFAHTHH